MAGDTILIRRKADGFTVDMPASQWRGYGDAERAEWTILTPEIMTEEEDDGQDSP